MTVARCLFPCENGKHDIYLVINTSHFFQYAPDHAEMSYREQDHGLFTDQYRIWKHGSGGRVMAIISPESAPVKRMIQESRDRGELIDATYGRKTRSVLVMDSGQIILSAVQPETISHRLTDRDVLVADKTGGEA